MRIAFGFLAVTLLVLLSSSTFAQGRGSAQSNANAARGQTQAAAARGSRVEQALSNRQEVLNRVLDRTEGTPRANDAAQTRGSIPDVAALRRSALERVGSQGVGPQAIGSPGSGSQGIGSQGLGARGLGAQNQIGRLNRETARGRATGIENRAMPLERVDALRRSGLGIDRARRPEGLPSQARVDASAADRDVPRARGEESFSRRSPVALTQAERFLALRQATIDRLRDVALRDGDVGLLEHADRLEELARQQYDLLTNGTKLNVPPIFRREPPTHETDSGSMSPMPIGGTDTPPIILE